MLGFSGALGLGGESWKNGDLNCEQRRRTGPFYLSDAHLYCGYMLLCRSHDFPDKSYNCDLTNPLISHCGVNNSLLDLPT